MLTLNECFKALSSNIINNGNSVSPRGILTKELIAPIVQLDNPMNRIITYENRCTDLFYALGELFWYLSGTDKLDFIQYYAPSIKQYSDDGDTLNSAYGHRIFKKWSNQWNRCISILQNDQDSRHAVIFIREPYDLFKTTKDAVCTNCLSFLIRDNKLHMITSMRSNDLYVGFVFDTFCFTMLQELMAKQLNIELGIYKHIPTSLHIYHNWFDVANSIALECHQQDGAMKQMQFNQDIESEIANVLKYEQMIRTEPLSIVQHIEQELYTTIAIANYWIDMLFVLVFKRFLFNKMYDSCNSIISHLENNANNTLFAQLLMRKLIAKSKKTI